MQEKFIIVIKGIMDKNVGVNYLTRGIPTVSGRYLISKLYNTSIKPKYIYFIRKKEGATDGFYGL